MGTNFQKVCNRVVLCHRAKMRISYSRRSLNDSWVSYRKFASYFVLIRILAQYGAPTTINHVHIYNYIYHRRSLSCVTFYPGTRVPGTRVPGSNCSCCVVFSVVSRDFCTQWVVFFEISKTGLLGGQSARLSFCAAGFEIPHCANFSEPFCL